MKTLVKHAAVPISICTALLAAAPAMAQSTRSSGPSWVPYTSNGYLGLNVGKPDYNLPCSAGFACDNPSASFHIYTGGSFNDWLGAEFGYLHMGKADRQGGSTRGHGLNLSLVGTVPVGQSFKVFGKLGTTWGRTEVTASALSGEPVGTENGFGASYGAGVQYDVSQFWGVVAQWDRHQMKFAGRGREDVDSASVGVKFKF